MTTQSGGDSLLYFSEYRYIEMSGVDQEILEGIPYEVVFQNLPHVIIRLPAMTEENTEEWIADVIKFLTNYYSHHPHFVDIGEIHV